MSQHTPGPWEWHYKFTKTSKRIIVSESANSGVIAPIPSWGSTEETEANAALIAAAPELLEAAVLAAEVLIRNPEPLAGSGDCYHALRAAIAKAKGEQR